MRILIETAGMPRLEWLKWRRKGIGASDIAALLSASNWDTPHSIWMDKTGKVELDATVETDVMWVGKKVEPIIAERAAEEQDLRVERYPKIIQHDTCDHVLADLDYLAWRGEQRLPLECKLTTKGAIWEEGVPLYYQFQVLQQLAILGDPVGLLAVMLLLPFGGVAFEYHPIHYNEKVIAAMLEAAEYFWETYVIPDIPPPASVEDMPAMVSIAKQIEGEKTALSIAATEIDTQPLRRVALAAADFTDSARRAGFGPADVDEVIDWYKLAGAVRLAAEKAEKAAKALLIEGMGNAEFGITPKHLVKLNLIDSDRFDSKAWEAAQPKASAKAKAKYRHTVRSARVTAKNIDSLPEATQAELRAPLPEGESA